MITIHAREAFYIKTKSLEPQVRKRLIDRFRFRFYEEKACKKCEVYDDRMASEDKHLDVCDSCPAYQGGAELASQVKIGNVSYIKTPIGNLGTVKRILDHQEVEFKVKSHQPDTDMKRKFKFTGEYKAYQPEVVKAIIEKKRGVVKAPPRSGKTVMSAAAVAKIGKKTIIIASQREWLLGFQETFIGSKTQKALTTCKPSQIGIAKTMADFEKYDICLCTVQTFWSDKGQRLLRKIRDMFAVMIVDEVHTGAAPKYAMCISALNCQWKIGLSGTPSRKDGRFILMRNLMGPNIIDVKVERLRPHVRLVRSEYVFKAKGQRPWVSMVSSLEKDPKRLRLIAQWALRDAKAGHMVLIPFAQITPIKALIMAINRLAGREVAFPFHGGVKKAFRDRYIERARQYKIRILVGNIKLLSTGTNIPRASAIYEVTMSSNKENCEQRISRVLTPWDDKPVPIVRIFLDDSNVRRNCLRNEWFQVIKPKFRPIVSDRDEEVLRGYFSNKKADRPFHMDV